MSRLVFILFLIYESLPAQNLVPNPSFEEYDSCPDNITQLNRASHWVYVSYATSDYFNSCETITPYSVSIPDNFLGHQTAHVGQAYAGAFFSAGDSIFFEDYFQQIEYLGVQLREPMKTILYKVSFYVSNADSASNLPNGQKVAGGGINIFNCNFSSSFYFEPTFYMLHVEPDFEVKFKNPITDSLGWTKVEGYYYGREGDQYMIIGQLNRNYSDYITNRYDYSAGYAAIVTYYYYDDVEVVPVSEDEFPNIFSPNGDGINDEFNLKINCLDCGLQLQIYNRWGNLLVENNTFKWDGKVRDKLCSDGTYYYVLRDTVSNRSVHSGFFQLQQ